MKIKWIVSRPIPYCFNYIKTLLFPQMTSKVWIHCTSPGHVGITMVETLSMPHVLNRFGELLLRIDVSKQKHDLHRSLLELLCQGILSDRDLNQKQVNWKPNDMTSYCILIGILLCLCHPYCQLCYVNMYMSMPSILSAMLC